MLAIVIAISLNVFISTVGSTEKIVWLLEPFIITLLKTKKSTTEIADLYAHNFDALLVNN